MNQNQKQSEKGSILIWIMLWACIAIFMGITIVAVGMESHEQKIHHQQGKMAFYIGEGACTYTYAQLEYIVEQAILNGYQEAIKDMLVALNDEKQRRDDWLMEEDGEENLNCRWGSFDYDSIIQKGFVYGYTSYIKQFFNNKKARDELLFLLENEFWDQYIENWLIKSKIEKVYFYPKEKEVLCYFTMRTNSYVDQVFRTFQSLYTIYIPDSSTISYKVKWSLIPTVEGIRCEFDFDLDQDPQLFAPYSQWITMKVSNQYES